MKHFLRRIALGAAMMGGLAFCVQATATQELLLEPRMVQGRGSFLNIVLTAENRSADIAGIGTVDGLFLFGVAPDMPSLLPATWQVTPGQSIHLLLENHLACRQMPTLDAVTPDQTNIHLHGALVSPHDKDIRGQYGDYSFVTVTSQGPGCAPTNAVAGSSHQHLEMETGHAEYQIDVPKDHPSGLYWYHPHVHSVAGKQVGGGMSGLLSIGKVWDYAYISCEIGSTTATRCATLQAAKNELALRAATDLHFLMLKDLQILRTSEPARWQITDDYDSGLCNTTADNYRLGYCDSADGAKRWLFTVNGQHLPNISIGAGRGAVLRIANTSANVSYILALRVQAPNGRIVYAPFQVLAVDGVRRVTSGTGPMTDTSILMMPAARAELYVSSTIICRNLVEQKVQGECDKMLRATLEQQGMTTGAGNDGDTWPRVDLATITFDASGPGSAPALNVSGPTVLNFRPFKQLTSNRALIRASTAPKAVAMKCDDGSPATTLDTTRGEYRLIALKNGICINGTVNGCDPQSASSKEMFGMVTESRVLTGTPADVTPSKPYQAFDHGRVDLCVGAPIAAGGYEETWVVSNQAKELHNFHVHQSKFEVLEVHAGLHPEVAMNRPQIVGQFHDTYPVDAGGWIKLRIQFNRPQQVGKFVYHCHILEHEDNGMMSVVQVANTSHP